MSQANKQRLQTINSIIAEYQGQGYVLTLRQLYYQLDKLSEIKEADKLELKKLESFIENYQ